MIEDFIAAELETIEQAKRKMNGVQIGTVISLEDAMTLGRVQVQLGSIDAVDLQPWARVAVPMAGELCGFYFIPQVGDQVLVAFEHGDLNAPYIVGSLWSAFAPPPQTSPLPQIRCIRTLTGNQLVFEETPPAVTLQCGPTSPDPMPMPSSPVGPYSTVRVSGESVEISNPMEVSITVGAYSVTVSESGVTISVGAAEIDMTPASIDISAPDISISADGLLELSGGIVTIN